MASEVESIIRQVVKTSPPGDDSSVISDIKILLNNADADKLITSVLREQYTTDLTEDNKTSGDVKLIKLNGSYSLISKYNLNGMKFFDTKQGVSFDYDFINNKVIDIENSLPSSIDADAVKIIQGKLDTYLDTHYNEMSTGLVIPSEGNSGLTFIIVGEKLNDSNYYNGKWVSIYNWDVSSKTLESIVKVRVHYYEDGNVVMNTVKSEKLGMVEIADDVVDKISNYEKNFELNVLKKINVLNENKFKNLRRLLPISRSKIQWGRAIGNYKLGQDVVGGRH